MDPFQFGSADVGWFDVEASPSHRQDSAPPPPPQALFQATDFDTDKLRPANLSAAFDEPHEVEVAEAPLSSSTTSTPPLQDYLSHLVERVQGRGGESAPLHGAELSELLLHAARQQAFGDVDANTLAVVAQWLYEHVLAATAVSLLAEARQQLADESVAPSQAMVALHKVGWLRVVVIRSIALIATGRANRTDISSCSIYTFSTS